MRLAPRFTRLFALALLPALLTLTGCDAVKKITGDDSSDKDTAVSDSGGTTSPATDTTGASAAPVTPPPPSKPDPQRVISDFKGMVSNQIMDEHLRGLAALESGKEQLTEVDLRAAKISSEGLTALAALPELVHLKLGACQLRGAAYAPLAKLTNLEVLDLEHSQFDDVSMQYLSSLANLRELVLSGSQITDQSFRALIPLKKLEVIRVSSTRVDGSGFEVFTSKGSAAPLKVINADDTMFGTHGFRFVRAIPSLEVLTASAASVDNSSLQGLKGCAALRELGLANNPIGDQGLKPIGTLQNLEKLSFANDRGVTHVGLIIMKRLKKIKELDLNETGCTDQAARELKNLFPEAKIHFRGQTL